MFTMNEAKKTALWSRILSSPLLVLLAKGTVMSGLSRAAGLPWKYALPIGASAAFADLVWVYLERMANLRAIQHYNPQIQIPKSVYVI